MAYNKSLVKYHRRNSVAVSIGNVPLGGKNPVRVQTMLNTDTNDIDACIDQSIKCIEAGAEYIRITAQGENEANNLKFIKEGLFKKGYHTPIIADIHFNPKAAEIAATIVEKVRINPGNYTDKKRLKPQELSDDAYNAEIERIKSRFVPLLELCKKHNTAIRIGTNHGSLSDRIMGRYGDTPEGMAESAMDFLRICKDNNFNNVVLSMKASNTRIMVYATRLLVKKMMDEEMAFPIHLGVTEAGDGEDGRIKSAVGIGSLLADGIGDTIRVSLTEDPELEIPIAWKIVSYFNNIENHDAIEGFSSNPINPYVYNKRRAKKILNVGGGQSPVVIADLSHLKVIDDNTLMDLGFEKSKDAWKKSDQSPDYIYCGNKLTMIDNAPVKFIVKGDLDNQPNVSEEVYRSYSFEDFNSMDTEMVSFLEVDCNKLNNVNILSLRKLRNTILLLRSENENRMADYRATVIRLINAGCELPIIYRNVSIEEDLEKFQVSMSCDVGGLFIDGMGDGIMLSSPRTDIGRNVKTAFQILQSTGDRITKTEYISCPSCGRTNFDLMETLAKIKSKTAHLKGLKIGVMGCIVNGPGEMADAHYGYVGAGKGKITLYKGKEVIERNLPSGEAVERLINLIKRNGDWIEK